MASRDVLAAGAVVFGKGRTVLLVHRPRYDDWSFPKGKLDPDEHLVAAAVREVEEETGLRVRLGPPLPSQRYRNGGDRMKTVHYWVARAVDGEDVSGYEPNEEIDRVVWVDRGEAAALLTYPHDRETLTRALELRKRTHALVVVRHAAAHPRKAWDRDDRLRPLVEQGQDQARALAPMLAAYDVTRLVSSSSTRCVETVAPYAEASGWALQREDGLAEEDATAESVVKLVDELVVGEESAALCTHRPVLPAVFDALGVTDPQLDPGGMLVVHLRRGEVVATEVQQAR
jgi:8-oxo-dGTP diphosphatase